MKRGFKYKNNQNLVDNTKPSKLKLHSLRGPAKAEEDWP